MILELFAGVLLLQGEFDPGRQPDGNSMLLRGPEGWVVVDTGRHAAHTRLLLEHVAASGEPVVAVVNTHWHLDHVSGNVAVREAHPGLKVHASDAIDGALEGFLADSRKQLETMLARPGGDEEQKQAWREEIARIDLGAKLRPDEVVSAGGERTLAGLDLQVGLERRAATDGDVWLYDERHKLLIAGDLVTLPAPFLDTACAPRWQAALAKLAKMEFETLVPGHGAPMDRPAFAMYRTAFDGLLECAASEATPADCSRRWSTQAGRLLEGHDPGQTRGLIEYYVEHRLRGPATAPRCAAGD